MTKPKMIPAEYYDRLALGNDGYEKRQREIEDDCHRQRDAQERVSNKTWGMGCNG